MFSDDSDILVGLADGRLHCWYQPGVVFVDKDLLPLTTSSQEAPEFGRSAQILSLAGSRSVPLFCLYLVSILSLSYLCLSYLYLIYVYVYLYLYLISILSLSLSLSLSLTFFGSVYFSILLTAEC